MATADCTEAAWLCLCEIVCNTEKEAAVLCTRTTELNWDKTFPPTIAERLSIAVCMQEILPFKWRGYFPKHTSS